MLRIDPKVLDICQQLKDKLLSPSSDREEITIFLCGGAAQAETGFRLALGTKLGKIRSKYRYSVYYPESMFVELILGHRKYDLLSLENLLASSVNTVVIPMQSPGTFTELGAFANHAALRNKLTVIIDPKHEHSQSFINTGPIRYLKKHTDSQIIYQKMDIAAIDDLAKRISEAARKIASKYPVMPTLTNPLTSYEYYLAMIFVLDPVPKSVVIETASYLESADKTLVETVAETVINGLINERKVTFSRGMLSVPSQGIDELVVSFKTTKRSDELLGFLTKLRFEALNRILRHRVYYEWRGAARS
jgi:hypothetical protein